MRRFTLALLATGLSCAMCLNPEAARAQATDAFLGEIQTFATRSARAGGRRSTVR
jgi:hypothetical protein